VTDSSPQKSVLIVDDDSRQRDVLAEFLDHRGYRVRTAADGESALELLESALADLVLMDVRMPGMGGLRALECFRDRHPTVTVILLTAYAGVQDAVRAMRAGAADYLEKPIDLQELAVVVSEVIGSPDGSPHPQLPPLPDDFVVASDSMRRVVTEADLVAPTDATVLITGESGTGKELVAELIRARSPRSEQPLVCVNCAAIPESLVESELFGHARGAYTGADSDRAGRFEVAEGGTILLDEIGEMPVSIQPKLLRVLENGTFERVGESTSRTANVRVLASTNRDLEAEVRDERFREDLFWRLNVFRIHLPPLRERREAIAALIRRLLKRHGYDNVRVSPAAARAVEAHDWPGNVRELGSVLMRASILATGGVILPEHLPASLRGLADTTDGSAGAVESREVLTMEAAERRAIRDALASTGGNRTRAAKLLGISRRTLIYRLGRYGGEP